MTDWSGWAGRLAVDGLKGAVAGSVVPGLGTGIGAAIGVATDLVPALAGALAGANGAAVSAQVVEAMKPALADPSALHDPEQLTPLRIELARIALDDETARLSDVADARSTTVQLATAGSPIAWGAPVVSVIVLFFFGAMTTLLMTRVVPTGSEGVLNVVLGTLGGMATSVVSYWVGSSAGSARKDGILAQQRKGK